MVASGNGLKASLDLQPVDPWNFEILLKAPPICQGSILPGLTLVPLVVSDIGRLGSKAKHFRVTGV